jgi:hypothetical protein
MKSGFAGDEHPARRHFSDGATAANEKKYARSRRNSLTIFHKFVTQQQHCER